MMVAAATGAEGRSRSRSRSRQHGRRLGEKKCLVCKEGSHGACATHAVAQVCTSILREKHAVAIGAEQMAIALKTACGFREGASVPDICESWNKGGPGGFGAPPELEDVVGDCRYS